MAKNANTEATTKTTEAAAPDSRLIQLDVPAGDPSGLEGKQPRNAVIRALASTGNWTRGDIAKHITTLQYPNGNGKVPYQIVFQATKGIGNIKLVERAEKTEATAPTETAAAE